MNDNLDANVKEDIDLKSAISKLRWRVTFAIDFFQFVPKKKEKKKKNWDFSFLFLRRDFPA